MKKFLIIALIPFTLFAQRVDVKRSNKEIITLKVAGDYSAKKLELAVKANTNISSPILILKKNSSNGGADSLLSASYSGGITTLTATIYPNDTKALSSGNYSFDVTAFSNANDRKTIWKPSELNIIADVNNPSSHYDTAIVSNYLLVNQTDLADSLRIVRSSLLNKVDKEAGKGLSANDYTAAEKNKLASLSNYDDTAIQASLTNKADKTNKGNSLVLLGDSFIAQGIETGGAYTYYNGVGFFNLANSYLGHPFKIVKYSGIGGNTTAQMLARLSTDVIAYNPAYCLVFGGINDINSAVSASTAYANIQSIVNTLLTNKIKPILCTIPPSSAFDATESQQYFLFNQLIRNYATDNDYLILDLERAYISNTTTAAPKANYTSDGTHPNQLGSATLGLIAYTDLVNKIPTPRRFSNSNIDRNLLTVNSILTGTAGSKSGASTTGNVADSWSFSDGGYGDVIALSKESRTDYNGEWQVINKAGAVHEVTLYQTTYGMTAGSILIAQAEILLDNNITDFKGAYLDIQFRDAGGLTLYRYRNPYFASSDVNQTMLRNSLTVRIDGMTVPANISNVVVYMRIAYGTGIAKIGRIELRTN